MFYSVVTNAPFVGRVEKGVETSVYIKEFAVIRIPDTRGAYSPSRALSLTPVDFSSRMIHLLQQVFTSISSAQVALLSDYAQGEADFDSSANVLLYGILFAPAWAPYWYCIPLVGHGMRHRGIVLRWA